MERVTLTVNGRPYDADVLPRTHLGDFLRDHLQLTGTHLGCEQGVCGACTVTMDGRPQRSCIAFAADCDGSEIVTIEGFDHDPLMSELRTAFSKHHALQCGFCTPGMLATARDIVQRLGEVDEKRIRHELSGNICRCTGYVGIVSAIASVAKGRVPQPLTPALLDASTAVAGTVQTPLGAEATKHAEPSSQRVSSPQSSIGTAAKGGNAVEEQIRIAAAPDVVWAVLSDLRRVVPCVPGAELISFEGDQLQGRMRIALGPIKASFSGQAQVTFDPALQEGLIVGQGRDSGLGSSASGEARWRVLGADGGSSLIIVSLGWKLTGVLAQFNRGNLLRDIIRRMASDFASNLEASLAGQELPSSSTKPIGAWALLWSIIKARLSKPA